MAAVASSTPAALVTADEWFASGKRVHFDTSRKEIVPEKRKESLQVFRRVVVPVHTNPDALWLTMLPGFPDGSFGFSKIETLLQANRNLNTNSPRLYVEYVGQGNSDKPAQGYVYSTMERANLVEALWKEQGVKSTVLVSMDFSSLVMMELLQRQKLRETKGIRFPRIEHVMSVNGSYFADGHSLGGAIFNTPLVRSSFGSVSCSAAQRSDMVLNGMLLPLYSKEYRKVNAKLFKKELKEARKAIRLNQGSRIMSQLCCYADEHKTRADKWDLLTIYKDYCKEQDITFHLIGSDQDPFEGDQLLLVQKRMKEFLQGDGKIVTEVIAGGNKLATEQGQVLVERIVQMINRGKSSHQKPQKSWSQVDSPSSNNRMSWTSASPRDSYVDYGLAF